MLRNYYGHLNGLITVLQRTMCQDLNADKYAKSVTNQRIDKFWSLTHRRYTG